MAITAVAGAFGGLLTVPAMANDESARSNANHPLIGTWRMVASKYNDALAFSDWPDGWVSRKLITATDFIWVSYKAETGYLNQSAGGVWTATIDTYMEDVRFISDEKLSHVLAKKQTLTSKIDGKRWTLSGTFSSGARMQEIWERVDSPTPAGPNKVDTTTQATVAPDSAPKPPQLAPLPKSLPKLKSLPADFQ